AEPTRSRPRRGRIALADGCGRCGCRVTTSPARPIPPVRCAHSDLSFGGARPRLPPTAQDASQEPTTAPAHAPSAGIARPTSVDEPDRRLVLPFGRFVRTVPRDP